MVFAGPARNFPAQEGKGATLRIRGGRARLVAARGAEVESRASNTSAGRKFTVGPFLGLIVTSLDRQEFRDRVLNLLELDGLGKDDSAGRPGAASL